MFTEPPRASLKRAGIGSGSSPSRRVPATGCHHAAVRAKLVRSTQGAFASFLGGQVYENCGKIRRTGCLPAPARVPRGERVMESERVAVYAAIEKPVAGVRSARDDHLIDLWGAHVACWTGLILTGRSSRAANAPAPRFRRGGWYSPPSFWRQGDSKMQSEWRGLGSGPLARCCEKAFMIGLLVGALCAGGEQVSKASYSACRDHRLCSFGPETRLVPGDLGSRWSPAGTPG